MRFMHYEAMHYELINCTGRTDVWFADSAATIHVSPNQEDFTMYQAYTES